MTDNAIRKSRLSLAFFLNLFFTLFEIVGGFLTGSVAILSDAVHDFGDSIAIGLSWILDIKARKRPDADYTYGYGRYAVLGGMISSLILVAGSVAVIAEAIPRLFAPHSVDVPWMIGFAIFGVVVNGIAALSASKIAFRG
jgi:cobalt-zinc-cadmium efflux system protein